MATGAAENLSSRLANNRCNASDSITSIFFITTAQIPIRHWKKAWAPSPPLVQQGKALYVGLSNYRPERAAAAADILAGLGTPCLIHQPRYNMRDRRVTDEYENEQNLCDVADQAGFGLITFSPLAQGLLSDRYLDAIPGGSRAERQGGHLLAKARDVNINGSLPARDIAAVRGQSIVQLAPSMESARLPQTTSVLIGASSRTNR